MPIMARNMGIISKKTSFFEEDTIAVECDDGFRLAAKGESRLRCLPSGEWSAAPECERKFRVNIVKDFV